MSAVTDPKDLVYYNGIIINDAARPIVAEINDIRAQALIEVPEEWDMSIVRFDISSLMLPFAKAPMFTGTPVFPGTFQTALQCQMGTTFGYVLAENARGEYNDLSLLIRYFNFAVKRAFVLLSPALQATLLDAPQFYIAPSGKLRLIFPAIWTDETVTRPDLTFNALWAQYLIGFPLWRSDKFGFTPDGTDARIRMEDPAFVVKLLDRTGLPIAFGSTVYGVGSDLCYIEEMYESKGSFSAVRAISLTTTSLPVQSEVTPNSSSSSQQGATSNNSASIISDFLMSTTNYTDQNRIEYLPQAEYRMSHLMGREGPRRVVIQAWWVDHFGGRFPMLLEQFGTFAVKILFRRRYNSG
jgi:hypothetical protein